MRRNAFQIAVAVFSFGEFIFWRRQLPYTAARYGRENCNPESTPGSSHVPFPVSKDWPRNLTSSRASRARTRVFQKTFEVDFSAFFALF